jgi:hypothetical protein
VPLPDALAATGAGTAFIGRSPDGGAPAAVWDTELGCYGISCGAVTAPVGAA